MTFSKIDISPSWQESLYPEFEKPYMPALQDFIAERSLQGATVYPPENCLFRSLNLTPLNMVKVVILGQDPYHRPGQAQGLSFSVADGVRPPPSLVNIYKELSSDLNYSAPKSGDLSLWAKRGVLLLNSVLTVEQGQAGSHRGKGWETFTDAIIRTLNEQRNHVVFILWGSYAWKKGAFINSEKHCIIKSPHPSPLSAYRGFFGSKPFSKANAYLKKNGIDPVDWKLA